MSSSTTSSEKPDKLYRIVGKVESTYDRATKKQKVLKVSATEKEKKILTVIAPYDMFCPVSEGDAITAICSAQYNPQAKEGNKIELLIEQPPFVTLGVDRPTVIHCFIKGLKSVPGNAIGNVKANKLYDRFARLNRTVNQNWINRFAEMSAEEKQTIHSNGTVEKEVIAYITGLSNRYVTSGDDSFFGLFDDVITARQLGILLQWWNKHRSLRRLYLLGLNNTEIKAIEDRSLDDIYEQCVKNPFVIPQLEEKKCIEIRKRLSKEATYEEKRCGQIIRKIYEYNKGGHTGITIEMLAQKFHDISVYLPKLTSEYGLEGDMDYKTVYLKYPLMSEKEVAKHIADMIIDNDSEYNKRSQIDPNFQDKRLTDEQKRAVEMALNNTISIITGAPGTGKSSVIREICHNLELWDRSSCVVSYTGKAVARLKEILLDKRPSTMHKMISRGDAGGKDVKFVHLIIDEAGMVYLNILFKFMQVFDFRYKITFVGDINQLKPIEYGNVFSQLMACEYVPRTELTVIHRVKRSKNISGKKDPGIKNGIIENTSRMLECAKNRKKFRFEEFPNFHFEECGVEHIYDVVRYLLEKRNINCNSVTVICPYNKNVHEINEQLQEIFNEEREWVMDSRDKKWMIGDRVMMTENNYDIDIMNGEEGIVVDVSLDEGWIEVIFNQKYANIEDLINSKFDTGGKGKVSHSDYTRHRFLLEPSQKKRGNNAEWQGFYGGEKYVKGEELTVLKLQHSYCITVHRAQGSEWDYVIFYAPIGHPSNYTSFFDRHLIYTATTRPKREVWCLGDILAMQEGATRESAKKIDNLGKRIRKIVERKRNIEVNYK